MTDPNHINYNKEIFNREKTPEEIREAEIRRATMARASIFMTQNLDDIAKTPEKAAADELAGNVGAILAPLILLGNPVMAPFIEAQIAEIILDDPEKTKK